MSEPLKAEADHPLNFVLNSGQGQNSEIYTFSKELGSFADGQGYTTWLSAVRGIANRRNQILYATDEGCPSVSLSDDFILEARRRICVLTVIAIALLQTNEIQLFVVQCLEAFLSAIKKSPDIGFDFKSATVADGPIMNIVKVRGEKPTMSRGYRVAVPFKVTISKEWPEIIRVSF